MVTWSVQPLIPGSLWAALAAAAIALLAWYALRRPPVVSAGRWGAIVAMMSISAALVLLVLLNPIRVETIPPPPGKPLLTVLVDATASMATPDVDGSTRYRAATDVAAKLFSDLSDEFDVRVRSFVADGASDTDPKQIAGRPPVGRSTDLSLAIESSLDQDRPQGQAIALLSDGAHNASIVANVLASARLARAMASPVYTRTFGMQTGGFDLGVELRSSQDLAFVGQKVLLSAHVTHIGLAHTHPNVILYQDGQEIARQQADIPADGGDAGASIPAEVHFWVSRDKVGVFPYEVRVEPLPGELTQANNSAPYLLRVVDQPIHVLQIEGKPYWDSKFLMRTLASVPAVELDSAVRITDERVMWRALTRAGSPTSNAATEPSAAEPSATEPSTGGAVDPTPDSTRVEKWEIRNNAATLLSTPAALKKYQIIVLGRDVESFLTDAAVANLQNWVTHDGGALVCYRGSPTSITNEKLSRLLPVRWTPGSEQRYRVKMTDQGRELHWLADVGWDADTDPLAQLPALADTSEARRSKPLAIVLATGMHGSGEPSPVVVYQPYGAGRVVVIEGAGIWRWAFLPPQYQKQEEVYPALWHSMLRWLVTGVGLMPGQKMSLRVEKLSFSTSEPAGATVLVREEARKGGPPAVELIADNASGNAEPAKSYAPAPIPDEPGSFRVNFGVLPEGRYRANIAGAGPEDSFSRTVFDVRAIGQEELQLTARPELMQRIAEESGGSVLSENPVGELLQQFSEHQARTHPPRSHQTSAWDRWWILAGILGMWTASWWTRRAGGLV